MKARLSTAFFLSVGLALLLVFAVVAQEAQMEAKLKSNLYTDHIEPHPNHRNPMSLNYALDTIFTSASTFNLPSATYVLDVDSKDNCINLDTSPASREIIPAGTYTVRVTGNAYYGRTVPFDNVFVRYTGADSLDHSEAIPIGSSRSMQLGDGYGFHAFFADWSDLSDNHGSVVLQIGAMQVHVDGKDNSINLDASPAARVIIPAGTYTVRVTGNAYYGRTASFDNVLVRYTGADSLDHSEAIPIGSSRLLWLGDGYGFHAFFADWSDLNDNHGEIKLEFHGEEITKELILGVVSETEKTVDQLRKENIDTSAIESTLTEVRDALENEDHELAQQLASDASSKANSLWSVYQSIEDTRNAIKEIEELGCNVTEAENKTRDAADALNKGNLDIAEQYVQEAITLANETNCGEISVVELKALAVKYDGKTIRISGNIKDMKAIYGSGYEIIIDDDTGSIVVRYEGSMRGIDSGDDVVIEGVFSRSSGAIAANEVKKPGISAFLGEYLDFILLTSIIGASAVIGILVIAGGAILYIRSSKKD